jgi:hypothetical protein
MCRTVVKKQCRYSVSLFVNFKMSDKGEKYRLSPHSVGNLGDVVVKTGEARELLDLESWPSDNGGLGLVETSSIFRRYIIPPRQCTYHQPSSYTTFRNYHHVIILHCTDLIIR